MSYVVLADPLQGLVFHLPHSVSSRLTSNLVWPWDLSIPLSAEASLLAGLARLELLLSFADGNDGQSIESAQRCEQHP